MKPPSLRSYIFWNISLIILLFVIIALFNALMDPGGVYLRRLAKKYHATAYVKTLLQSEHGMIQEGWNERDIKIALAQQADNFECVLIGSSRVMQVSPYRSGGQLEHNCLTFANLGVSGAVLEDTLIFSYILASTPKPPKQVWIGLDPQSLGWRRSAFWQQYSALYNDAAHYFGIDDVVQESSYDLALLLNLINLDYTKESLNKLWQEGLDISYLRPFYDPKSAMKNYIMGDVNIDQGNDTPVTLPDGSHVYSQEYLSQTHDMTRQYSVQFETAFEKSAVDALAKIINTLKSNDIDVKLILPPYPHEIWDNSLSETLFYIEESEPFIREFAKTHNIEVWGSFYPDKIPCTRDEFIDAIHPTASCANRIITNHMN